MRRLVLMLLGVALAAGCGHVEADHPYDPEAPREAQHRARLRGQVAGLSADAVAEARVQLREGESDDPRYEVLLDEAGNFLFQAVLVGTYRLVVEAPGVEFAPRVIDLGPARDLDLGTIDLAAGGGATGGRVLGRVVFADKPDGPHGGVLLETQSGQAAVSLPDGVFRIDYAAGDQGVRFSYPGYETQLVGTGEVPAGETFTLDADVVLAPSPCSLQGRVTLRSFGSPERLLQVQVSLTSLAGDSLPLTLGENGSFVAEGLAPGTWILQAGDSGYAPVVRPVELEPGEAVDLGEVQLTHRSTGPDAVALAGRVVDGDGAGQVGVEVEVRFQTPDQAFRSATTDAEGRFEVPAAADEAYVITALGASVGPVTWDADAGAFQTDAGEAPELVVGQ